MDRDKDNKADQVYTIATGLRSPSGITFRDGSLYVAEINRVIRYDGIESKLDAPPEPAVVNDKLPTEAHHGWKYFGVRTRRMALCALWAPPAMSASDPMTSASRRSCG